MSAPRGQHDFPTARYLDDPVRYSGLTITQWLAAANSCGQGYGAWLLIQVGGPFSLPVGGAWGLGLRVFLCSLWMAATFLTVILLAGSARREQFGRQYLDYLLRRHRYGPPPPPRPARYRSRRKIKDRFTVMHHTPAPPEKKAAPGAAPRLWRVHHGAHRGVPEAAPQSSTAQRTGPLSCGGAHTSKKARKGKRI